MQNKDEDSFLTSSLVQVHYYLHHDETSGISNCSKVCLAWCRHSSLLFSIWKTYISFVFCIQHSAEQNDCGLVTDYETIPKCAYIICIEYKR